MFDLLREEDENTSYILALDFVGFLASLVPTEEDSQWICPSWHPLVEKR